MSVKELERINQIDKNEFENMSNILYNSFSIKIENKDKESFQIKEEIINEFSIFLNKLIEMQFLNSKKNKLELINFIDKLNVQRELLELAKGQTNIADIKKAAKKLGKKSQSSFKTK